MKRFEKILTPIVLIVLVGMGCAGGAIIDMNREFSSLHAQRVAIDAEIASASRDGGNAEAIRDYELVLADVDNRFIDLAERAKEAAEKSEAGGNDLDAISYYRVGAVAAWLGGASILAELTHGGSGLCDSQDDGIASAPRDCAMLKTIDYLAVNSKYAPELKKLAAEENALKEFRRNPEVWIGKIKETGVRDRTKDVFNKLLNASEQIAEIGSEVDSPKVPVSTRFKKVLGLRAFNVACNAHHALEILDQLTLPNDFDRSRIPANLRAEMEQWASELKSARGLKDDLDKLLGKEVNVSNCYGRE